MERIDFRTSLDSWPGEVEISYGEGLLCMGSCFAEHIGARLGARKFRTLVNPAGIIYNPVSLAQSLGWMAEGRKFGEEDVFEWQGQWNSYYHHSRFSALSRDAILEGINQGMDVAGQFFREHTDRLLLSLGTGLVYEHVAREEIVANCHKLPASTFSRRRLSVSEVVDALGACFQLLLRHRPDLKIILTVSPVRHLREGMVENQRSKATLVLAAAQLAETFSAVHYFPAYELLLDDLRDYRFYADDLVHPGTQGVEYIWRFFTQTYFSEETKGIVQEVEALLRAADHRPFQSDSESHRTFLASQLEKARALEKKYPFLDLGAEKEHFKAF